MVTAEQPYSITLDPAPEIFADQSASISGYIFGSPTCGLPGHLVGNQGRAVGDAPVHITFTDSTSPQDVVSGKYGEFHASFMPLNSGAVTVTVTSGSAPAKSITYQIYPAITSIMPTVGLASGGTPVTINGNGFVGSGALNNPTGVAFSAQAGAPGSAIAVSGSVSPPNVINARTPLSPLTANNGVGTVDVSATITESGGQVLQSKSSVPYTYALPYYPIPSFQPGGNCIGGQMVLSAYDEALQPLSSGVLVRPNTPTNPPLGNAFLGQPVSVRARGTYYVQVDAGTVAGPVVPITVPSNLIFYCIPLVWFPPSSYFGPETPQIVSDVLVGGLAHWRGGNPAYGTFDLNLTVPIASEVSNGLVVVIPTAAELQTLATAKNTLINGSGTPTKVQLVGTMFNLTARSQEGILNPAQPEVFLPEPGDLLYNAPNGSSGPMTQYRVMHAMELSHGLTWVDVTTSFGSRTLSASVIDEGWYALVSVTPAMALETLPAPLTACANGVCAACEANGFKTTTAANCCSNQLDAGACACIASGQACTSDQGCCSNWCSNYVGGVGTCLPAPLESSCQVGNFYCVEQPNQPCECAGQNASTVCSGNVCCSDAFGLCPNGQADCCGGNTCVNGTCLITSGDPLCNQSQWTPTQQNAACVSGSCNTATGNCN